MESNALVERIKARRVERGTTARPLSVTAAAAELGIGKGTLSNIELGRHRPSVETIRRLSRWLDVDFQELYNESQPDAE